MTLSIPLVTFIFLWYNLLYSTLPEKPSKTTTDLLTAKYLDTSCIIILSLTLVVFIGLYIGIINNQDAYITSMYIYTDLRTDEDRAAFVALGEAWWWESNRMIPINIFLNSDMQRFKYVMMTMNSKDVKVSLGPTVNLNKLSVKRVKRKSVQLLKKPSK